MYVNIFSVVPMSVSLVFLFRFCFILFYFLCLCLFLFLFCLFVYILREAIRAPSARMVILGTPGSPVCS